MDFKKLQKQAITEFIEEIHSYWLLNINNKFNNKESFSLFFFSGILDDFSDIISKPLLVLLKSMQNINKNHINGILTFLDENYPILKKHRNKLISNYTENFQELLNRLEKDYEELKNLGFINDSEIKSINLKLGDRHWEGKSVCLIEFKDNKKLIYKPRNLMIDVFFKNFLYLFEKDLNIDFGWGLVLNKNSYGWCEYIYNTECSSYVEVKNFYYRMGFLLCILYSLEATDFHYENIISKGEYPILIDLESFFHPYIPIDGTETNQGLDKSVLRTGLLPTNFNINKENIDISGLSDVSNVDSFLNNQELKEDDLGNVFLVREKNKLKEGQNIPSIKGEKIYISKYKNFFIKGFEDCYMSFLKNRESILTNIDELNECYIRVLFRDTVVYSHLLQESIHPTLLKNEESLYKHFSWLKVVIPDYKIIERIVDIEIESLQNTDIPLFMTKVNSKNLWYGKDKFIKNFFEKTGIETVKEKIKSLSKEDLNLQKWYINKSINIIDFITSHKDNSHSKEKIFFKKNKSKSLEERLKEQILRVYNYIKENIYYSKEKKVSWLVYKPETMDGLRYSIYPASYDLYSGMPGEILFLFCVENIFNLVEDNLFEQTYQSYISLISDISTSIKPIGQYTGWGSVISLNNLLYDLSSDSKFLDNNKILYDSLNFKDLIDKDKNYSLIKGTAGFISSSMDFYKRSEYKNALDISEYAAKHLMKNSINYSESMLGWKITSDFALSGLAHGSSGFLIAFLKLYVNTQYLYYKDIMEKIIKYENSLFNEKEGNWIDLRKHTIDKYGKGVFLTAWSHGAGGIGLTRLELILNNFKFSNINIEKDLEYALKKVIKQGFTGDNSLIFGDLGNIELLINYNEHFENSYIKEFTVNKINTILENVENMNFYAHDSIKTLGIMSGLTGIGYQFLRFLDSKKIPSILLIK